MKNWNKNFDKYVGNSLRYQPPANTSELAEDYIKTIGSDIGRNVEFDRVAVHHVILPANCRTSSPHAESLEEEFVFVLSGKVDLWLNGYIHNLKKGHAVGFPAGTGVAHTFINNSNSDVHLLVSGETTKDENLCSFPINPELKADCEIWWDEAPVHDLGPHSGLPGVVSEQDLALKPADCIVYCPDIKKQESFNYPGDNETFGTGFRITDEVGLEALGINYERLEPGKRSAFPHAHTHEEEFVYVIKGQPTVWMNGYTKVLEEGQFAAFPSSTGINHAIINNTEEDIYYICIGEACEFPEEKIFYPHNPLRNKECDKKAWLWNDIPQLQRGTHKGLPDKPIEDHLNFRLCDEGSAEEVLEIYKQSPTYFKKVEGCLPNLEIAKKSILDQSDKIIKTFYKEFLIIEHNKKPIGVLDIHINHPEEGVCYIGLLLIKENQFGQGLGTKCYELAEQYIKQGLDCKKIRLGVSELNNVSHFWEKQGFKPSDNTYTWKGEAVEAQVLELEKNLN